MDYIQIQIETTTEAVEAISYILMEQGVGGVEIQDPKDIIMSSKSPITWDYLDEKLISTDPDVVIIKAYFPEHINISEKIADIQIRINEMKTYLDVGRGKISTSYVEEESWANEWKKYYKPTPIGDKIIIKPTWEDYTKQKDDEIIIELDPGMAFGTGTHETTSMCVELLEKYVSKEDVVIDIGTGSGILGITAAKLGAKQVVGVDLDQTAVGVAKENVLKNNVDTQVDIRYGDLIQVVEEKGNIVVANIIADVIISLSGVVSEVMLDNAVFISSGIIADRILDVTSALEAHFEILETLKKGEWAAIVCKKKR